jgi:hypothetical protein
MGYELRRILVDSKNGGNRKIVRYSPICIVICRSCLSGNIKKGSKMEEWKQYQDTNYRVSNTGFIKNSVTNKILKTTKTRQGYMCFAMWHNGSNKTVRVHRLVAEIYLENIDNKPIVNHIDGNPSNNHVSNLEWATIRENIVHAYATGLAAVGEDCTVAKLSEKQVFAIIEDLKQKKSIVDTASKFGVSAAAISHIWHGNTWKHIKRDKPTTPNYKGKLVVTDIPIIRSLFKDHTDSQIGAIYGVNRASIRNIRVGLNWKNY